MLATQEVITNYFEQYAQTLYYKGYSVIPLMPNKVSRYAATRMSHFTRAE